MDESSRNVDKDDKKVEIVQLKRELKLIHGVAILIGVIIGSGIFVSPVGILKETKSIGFSYVMWVSCGLYNGLCALSYAELGTTVPESGGEYIYIQRAFGDLPAFICLWINFILICPVAIAACALIFSMYILKPFFPDCVIPELGLNLLAASTFSKDIYTVSLKYLITDIIMAWYNCPIWLITIYDIVHVMPFSSPYNIASMHIHLRVITWKADHACFKSNWGQTNDLIVFSAYNCIDISVTPQYWFAVSGPPTKIGPTFFHPKQIYHCLQQKQCFLAICLVLLQKIWMFGLSRIPFYSGFDLSRFHCTHASHSPRNENLDLVVRIKFLNLFFIYIPK